MHPYFTPDAIARFWSKVDRSGGPDACWLWTAGRYNTGYGCFNVKPHSYLAHRVAFMLTYGNVLPGICICHTCDVRRCVNPAHLFAGTQADNLADMARKGRGRKPGFDNLPLRRLTPIQVAELRARMLAGEKQTALAREYGVSQSVVSSIKLRQTYRS